ncbi:hypothetical protein GBF38_018002 [Nibea albiflora]|uniref:Uncharacterized protein n=1 Tax=Nibea albiflora TaxID=240163 RepID=A0ACB7F5A1_NIBAL|nr:hypothetical protein GBF38_018002 [Nibea albiflora]
MSSRKWVTMSPNAFKLFPGLSIATNQCLDQRMDDRDRKTSTFAIDEQQGLEETAWTPAAAGLYEASRIKASDEEQVIKYFSGFIIPRRASLHMRHIEHPAVIDCDFQLAVTSTGIDRRAKFCVSSTA